MEEIRGTNKKTSDSVNDSVRKWGFKSYPLTFIIVGFMISGLILMYLIGFYVIVYLFLYAFVVNQVSKYLVKMQRKGIEDPISDVLEYNSLEKRLQQNIDFRKAYEDKRIK